MKIYQIHEYGGSYEDKYDYIVESYLPKGKAEQHLKRLEKEQKEDIEQYVKCGNCPLYHITCRSLTEEEKAEETRNYCDKHNIEFYDDKDIYCAGEPYCTDYIYNYDEANFRIEEVDVIE